MPRTIQWESYAGIVEIRLGLTPPIARYTLSTTPRAGEGPLFHQAYQASLSDLALPAALLPLVTQAGEPVDLAPVVQARAPAAILRTAQLVLPPRHPPVSRSHSPARGPEVVPALWLQGLSVDQAEELQRQADLVYGLYIYEDERVASLGHAFSFGTSWLRRLPRILFEDHHLIADNTDAAVSMGQLLEDFVQRFSDPEHALPHIRLATGYLYHHGLARVLSLLKNPAIRSLHVLFSGQTDRSTARALTAIFDEQLAHGLEASDDDTLWHACRDAAASGRFDVRVYTDAFLHAKLFLGYDRLDHHQKLMTSLAVIGSSNLSAPGLQANGNLELDVTLEDRDGNTRLYRWFEERWHEAAPTEPTLLQVLESRRPQPPPTLATDGLLEVWKAGRHGAFVAHDHHLGLLARLYADRLRRLEIPTDAPFPEDPQRTLHPSREQEEGVLALVQRLAENRVAFLADSVGLGKTITALGTAWYVKRRSQARTIAVVSPQKLVDQWRADMNRIRLDLGVVKFLNRHKLERLDEAQARAQLHGVGLLVVEEAHEALRSRRNKLWLNLRAHLAANPDCQLLLISATPWNNSREDIFNYLLLAWREGRLLKPLYPGLQVRPLSQEVDRFMTQPVGLAVRHFLEMPVDRYRHLFDAVFVQRTRSALLHRYGSSLDFPERKVHPHTTPPAPRYDALFTTLEEVLADLSVPYREPFQAVMRAAYQVRPTPGASPPPASNLHRSFLIQLYKRAESSTFALAISLWNIVGRLRAFEAHLRGLLAQPDPLLALTRWLEESYLQLEDGEGLEDPDSLLVSAPEMTAAEKARYGNLSALLDQLDQAGAREILEALIDDQIHPDIQRIEGLRAQLDLDLDERSPKDLLLCRIVREAFGRGYKPLCIAGYADTALRYFIRLITLLPDARIALALGNDRAWVYRPETHHRGLLTEKEWLEAITSSAEERSTRLLIDAGRASFVPRAHALDAFAPRAREANPLVLGAAGGEIDILVGSEAISVGQNLQDSTALIQLDLPWNPMVIEQRIGRIDRRGGGRPDPDDPAGRRIVDVHYCWSNNAVEREVSLRERLRRKAGQAIEDTNFDELLLHELLEKVEQVRRRRGEVAADPAVTAVLNQRQQALVEARTRAGGIPAGTGSDLDGLRRLAGWTREHHPADQAGEADGAAPVIAAACACLDAGPAAPAWLLTLALTPLGPTGAPIPGGPLHAQLPLYRDTLPEQVQPDLEAVVRHLVDGQAPVARPGTGGSSWTARIRAVDALLQGWRRRFLEEHNQASAARLEAQLAPAAQRTPSARFRQLLVRAGDALEQEIARLGGHPGGEALLVRHEAQLDFLLGTVLQPAHVPDLFIDQEETLVEEALVFIRDFAHRFLERDFERVFGQLCGARFEAHRSGAVREVQAVLELPQLDGPWADLRIQVLAATWFIPETPTEP